MSYISHEDFKKLMGKFQKETPKGKLINEGLDPVGQEDSDIDNDGDTDKTDKYLLKRRKTIGKAIRRGRTMKEGDDDVFLDAVFDTLNDEMRLNNISGDVFDNAVKYLDKHGSKLSQMGHNPEDVADAIIKKVSGIDEYSYADNYPESWGYNEEKEEDDDIDTLVDLISRYTKDEPEKIANLDPEAWPDDVSTNMARDKDYQAYLAKQKGGHKEGLNPAPLQATGPTIDVKEGLNPAPMQATGQTMENSIANPPMGFAVLPPSDREQLREYINTIKTVQKEIEKLVAKAGRKVKMEGGDTTGKILTPTMEADESHEEIKKIESKIDPKLYQASMKLVAALKDAGLSNAEIGMFIKHEAEEAGEQERLGQWDIAEDAQPEGTDKKKVPAQAIKKGDIMMSTGEEVLNIWPGAKGMSGRLDMSKVTVELEKTKKDGTKSRRIGLWGKNTEVGVYRPTKAD